jgi:hypothetical protein
MSKRGKLTEPEAIVDDYDVRRDNPRRRHLVKLTRTVFEGHISLTDDEAMALQDELTKRYDRSSAIVFLRDTASERDDYASAEDILEAMVDKYECP